MNKKATIRDVAKHAGVSVASVSYVLNDIDKVTPETKAHILKSVKALDYRPNMTARCLSSGDSKLIGICLPIMEKGDYPGALLGDNPFYGEFISGIEYVTRNKGYDLLISGVSSNEQYREWIQRRNLDGIIMLGLYPYSIFEELKSMDIPVVLTDTYEEYGEKFHRVMMDDEAGGYMAAKYLIELGHRQIAFLAGSIKHSGVNSHRFRGYQRALSEAQIPFEQNFVYEEHVSFEGGYRAAEQMLKDDISVTAVFAAADTMAIGFMKAYSDHNKKIPEELSVIGFDDIQFGQYTSPGLTTIRQDVAKKGRVSAEMIVNDLAKGKRTKGSVMIAPKLVIRDSAAKPE